MSVLMPTRPAGNYDPAKAATEAMTRCDGMVPDGPAHDVHGYPSLHPDTARGVGDRLRNEDSITRDISPTPDMDL